MNFYSLLIGAVIGTVITLIITKGWGGIERTFRKKRACKMIRIQRDKYINKLNEIKTKSDNEKDVLLQAQKIARVDVNYDVRTIEVLESHFSKTILELFKQATQFGVEARVSCLDALLKNPQGNYKDSN